MQETWVLSLVQEDPLEEGMETHSSILAWRIPMDRSLAGYGPWDHRESETTEQLRAAHTGWKQKRNGVPGSVVPGCSAR